MTAFTDHPVHPPTRSTDPWNLEFPDDKNYLIKSKNGVFQVYKDQAGLEAMDFTYIKLDTFVQNMHTMCAMIADGPLYVEFLYFDFKIMKYNFLFISGNHSAIVVSVICILNFNCMYY